MKCKPYFMDEETKTTTFPIKQKWTTKKEVRQKKKLMNSYTRWQNYHLPLRNKNCISKLSIFPECIVPMALWIKPYSEQTHM